MKTTAIVLAAGVGKRMGGKIAKQFLLLEGRPVLYYTLANFEKSVVDEVILVTSADSMEYCRTEIVEKYGFRKVSKIVLGGKERYHSVMNGLFAIERSVADEITLSGDDAIEEKWEEACRYVFVHDGARLFATPDIIARGLMEVKNHPACVVGMPVKDTIKIVDEDGFVDMTPNRELVWQIQTPQIFEYELLLRAYMKFQDQEKDLLSRGVKITDDAMVIEEFTDVPVKLIEGSYNNIKLTTPEDLIVAENILKNSD